MVKQLVAVVVFGLVIAFNLADAQKSNKVKEKAKKVLDQVSDNYQAYNAIKADFKLTLENRQSDFEEVQKGTIYLKNQKFRVSLGDHIIICDGDNIWTYLKEVKEVQINNYKPEEMDINPTEMFTIYKKDFRYGYKGNKEKNGQTYDIVELTPENKEKSYFKVRLLINQTSHDVRQTKIFEKDGTIFTYQIKDFEPNPSIEKGTFSFQKNDYPNVETIDLRKKDN